jgi:hypothetical protein
MLLLQKYGMALEPQKRKDIPDNESYDKKGISMPLYGRF